MIQGLKYLNSLKWKWIVIAMKAILILGMITLIYHQVISNGRLSDLFSAFISSLGQSSPLLILIAIILVPTNWSLEALKWKTIVSSYKPTTLTESVKIILGGLSFGVLTPSRIGEYGGRFYMVEDDERWKTISATFIGSLSQNLITAIMGLLGASFLLFYSPVINPYLVSSLWYVASIAIIVGLAFYYKIGFIQHIVKFLPGKWASLCDQHSTFLTRLNLKTLNKVLLISFIRYMVYTMQYILLLLYFGIGVSPTEAFAAVSLIFLIQTGLPLPPVFDVLARGEIALTIWAMYSDNSLGILATAFGLWLINLIIPALIGLIYVIVHED